MRTWPLDIIGVLLVWLAIAAVACGDWVEVPCVRQTGYPGILGEIEDRMPRPTKWTGNTDPILWAHEATHGLNSHLSDSKTDVYFVPVAGHAFRITKPDHWVYAGIQDGMQSWEQRWPVTASELRQAFRRNWRSSMTATYLDLFDRQNTPDLFIDEVSAHVCGVEAGRQFSRDVALDVQSTLDMIDCSLVFARLVRQRGYPKTAAEIEEFCTWCAAYLRDNGLVR